MLDLAKVVPQIHSMTVNVLETQQEARDKLKLSHQLLCASDWRELSLRVSESKTSMLTALPTGDLTAAALSPGAPPVFSVFGTDGSQIVPDQHGPALCYLLNTGAVGIHYGSGERPQLESIPSLFYREEDLYLDIGGRQALVQGELLAARRADLEGCKLEELLADAAAKGRVSAALQDGSLIKWTLEQGAEWQVKLLQRYLQTLDHARKLRVPIGGYLSASRACDVINSLKLALCPEKPVDCDKCPCKGKDRPCDRLNGVTDVMLFSRVLRRPGERSQVFFSSSKVLREYGPHKIGFFYLHAGKEVARVEFPAWVLEDKGLLDLLHALVADQCAKGRGYPVVLSEAHSQAVIKGADRDAFFRLLESALVKGGATAAASPKSLSKRVAPV